MRTEQEIKQAIELIQYQIRAEQLKKQHGLGNMDLVKPLVDQISILEWVLNNG